MLAGYGFSTGDIVADPSFPLKDGHVQTNAMLLAYARSLDIWGATEQFDLILPYAWASGVATFAGQPRARDVPGLGDLRFAPTISATPP